MKVKTVFAIVLGAVAALGVAVLIAKGIGKSPPRESESRGGRAAGAAAEVATADGLAAFYVHRTFRCATCNRMEKFSREAVEGGFGEDLKAGRLRFAVVNVDEPANRHLIDELKVAANGVFVAQYKDGQVARSKYLDQVWELSGDREQFVRYVREELAAFMVGEK